MRVSAFACLGIALLAIGGGVWWRVHATRTFFDQRVLLSRFPVEDALVMSVDFGVLRRAGLTGDSKAPLEPEYRQFLEGTGFDYKRDLDSVTASFSRSGTYFIARGRFNWSQLRAYAVRQGGSCYEDLCRVQGSRPERHISFLPLRRDAIALAVSGNDLAATLLQKTGQRVTGPIPDAPVWLSVPGSELRQQDALPPGMHLMLSALTSADRVIITLGPAQATGAAGMEAHLEATCRTRDDARILASQLRTTTSLLKQALARGQSAGSDSTPGNDEVAMLLTGGRFDQQDRRVTGWWPVRKSLIDALTAGI